MKRNTKAVEVSACTLSEADLLIRSSGQLPDDEELYWNLKTGYTALDLGTGRERRLSNREAMKWCIRHLIPGRNLKRAFMALLERRAAQ